jgi:hypothetical protein
VLAQLSDSLDAGVSGRTTASGDASDDGTTGSDQRLSSVELQSVHAYENALFVSVFSFYKKVCELVPKSHEV